MPWHGRNAGRNTEKNIKMPALFKAGFWSEKCGVLSATREGLRSEPCSHPHAEHRETPGAGGTR